MAGETTPPPRGGDRSRTEEPALGTVTVESCAGRVCCLGGLTATRVAPMKEAVGTVIEAALKPTLLLAEAPPPPVGEAGRRCTGT